MLLEKNLGAAGRLEIGGEGRHRSEGGVLQAVTIESGLAISAMRAAVLVTGSFGFLRIGS